MKNLTLKITVLLALLTMAVATRAQGVAGWRMEDASGKARIVQTGDTLDITAPDGLTVWHTRRLTGLYEITYSAQMVTGKPSERLSDLNCFWAANDPLHPGDLWARGNWRNGIFARYNTLDLFYVGYGGNYNTTTRFRRYHGRYYGVDETRVKPLLHEYTDPPHLLKPGHWFTVCIRVEKERTTFSIDGRMLFQAPLQPGEGDGHFALRLLQNHVRVAGFRVRPLQSSDNKHHQ